MAELVDALVSGTSSLRRVQVRFLFWALKKLWVMSCELWVVRLETYTHQIAQVAELVDAPGWGPGDRFWSCKFDSCPGHGETPNQQSWFGIVIFWRGCIRLEGLVTGFERVPTSRDPGQLRSCEWWEVSEEIINHKSLIDIRYSITVGFSQRIKRLSK